MKHAVDDSRTDINKKVLSEPVLHENKRRKQTPSKTLR